MSEEVFDVKLIDGRYFSNIVICDEFGVCEDVKYILDNTFVTNTGLVANDLMTAFYESDKDGNIPLVSFYSSDIEYIAKGYGCE